MSFQAYIDNIKAKTGKTPEDFRKLAEKKGLLKPGVKAGEILNWLKEEYGLGHGHAMAIYTVFKGLKEAKKDVKGMLAKHFGGEKEKWRPAYDAMMKKINSFGSDVGTDIVISYISLLRGSRRFAIIQVTKDKLMIGLKLKGISPGDRYEPAGNWNAMMTHKVAIISSQEIDKDLYDKLLKAYEQAIAAK
ncbi:MAG: DUF4287 domain-containing protein [Flavipsychrobacter sp.]|nr:DUF4287 domain-containing protein [Flavipsychrobacter sp.]